ncbi:MAG: hypothetical protein AAF601_16420 [Pseudomonadota bacterium]
MTIVRNLPQQLILAHAPWLFGGALIVCIIACAAAGLALLAAGDPAGLPTVLVGACLPLTIFALAIKRDQVIFDAVSGSVTVQRRTLFSYSSQIFDLNAVTGAALEELSDTSRTLLRFTDGAQPYPLVEAFSSGNAPRRATQTINDWLSAARQQRSGCGARYLGSGS